MLTGLVLLFLVAAGCSPSTPEHTAIALEPVQAAYPDWGYDQQYIVLAYSGPGDPAEKLEEWDNTPGLDRGTIEHMPFLLFFDEISCETGDAQADLASVELGTEISYTIQSVARDSLPPAVEVGGLKASC